MSTKVIVFNYRWWRLKEGLTYTELEFPYNSIDINGITLPEGSYMYVYGKWYHSLRAVYKNMGPRRSLSLPPLTTLPVRPETVPKQVRAIALLLT